jgi:hypothetical protein
MAIDDNPVQEGSIFSTPEGPGPNRKLLVLYLVLAALAVGEIYTISQTTSLNSSVATQQARLKKELSAQLEEQISGRLANIETTNAQQLEGIKKQLDTGVKHGGPELKKTRAMLEKFQQEQNAQAEQLKQQIALKADQQQVGALTQDVSAAKSDLDNTKKGMESLRSDLGMARSELGTLIARTHDDIETLRKMGERDYFEFTLERKNPQTIAGVGLTLKKTNVKAHRFNLSVLADDMVIEKKDKTVNEPVIFFVHGSKKPFELVVNKVLSGKVIGYLSTPKGAEELAQRSTGGSR